MSGPFLEEDGAAKWVSPLFGDPLVSKGNQKDTTQRPDGPPKFEKHVSTTLEDAIQMLARKKKAPTLPKGEVCARSHGSVDGRNP